MIFIAGKFGLQFGGKFQLWGGKKNILFWGGLNACEFCQIFGGEKKHWFICLSQYWTLLLYFHWYFTLIFSLVPYSYIFTATGWGPPKPDNSQENGWFIFFLCLVVVDLSVILFSTIKACFFYNSVINFSSIFVNGNI
jgi:hypothetical protein